MITTIQNTPLHQMAIIRARMEGHTVYFRDFSNDDRQYHEFPHDYSFRFNSHIYMIKDYSMTDYQRSVLNEAEKIKSEMKKMLAMEKRGVELFKGYKDLINETLSKDVLKDEQCD